MDVLLKHKFQLPDEMWMVLTEEPEQSLRFSQGAYEVEVRLRKKPSLAVLPPPSIQSTQSTTATAEVGLSETPPLISRPAILTTAEKKKLEESSLSSISEPEPLLSPSPLSDPSIFLEGDSADPLDFMNSIISGQEDELSLGSDTMLVAAPPAIMSEPDTGTPQPQSVVSTMVPVATASSVPRLTPNGGISMDSLTSMSSMVAPQRTTPRSGLSTKGHLTPTPGTSTGGYRNTPLSGTGLPKASGPGSTMGFGLSAAIHGEVPIMEPSSDLSTQIGILSVPANMRTEDWQSLLEEAPQKETAPLTSPEELVPFINEPLTPSNQAVQPPSSATIQPPSQVAVATSSPVPVAAPAPMVMSDVALLAEDIAFESEGDDDDWSVELDIPKTSAQPQHNDWNVKEEVVFRLLRGSDTIPALKKLFSRNTADVSMLDQMFHDLPPHHPSPAQFAEASGVVRVLDQLIPLCYKSDETPHYRVIGACHDFSFVVLYQQPESMALVFMPLTIDEHIPQIALIEGEALLTEKELTDLFQAGARSASPEEAKEKARQVQKKLKTGSYHSIERVANFNLPSTSDEVDGLDKSIPVDQRLLNRFEFHRHHNRDLWDEELQPGIAVFRHNAATLFIDGKRVIEGVLLSLLKQQQYIVFDRRSKRSIHLQPDTEQRLWLRKDEAFEG